MNIILEAKLSLDSIDPRLFYVILTLLVFAVVYAVKKFDKDLFDNLPDSVKSLPAITLSVVLSGASNSTDMKSTFIGAIYGALSGLAAIGLHQSLKDSPLPYGNPPVEEKKEEGTL